MQTHLPVLILSLCVCVLPNVARAACPQLVAPQNAELDGTGCTSGNSGELEVSSQTNHRHDDGSVMRLLPTSCHHPPPHSSFTTGCAHLRRSPTILPGRGTFYFFFNLRIAHNRWPSLFRRAPFAALSRGCRSPVPLPILSHRITIRPTLGPSIPRHPAWFAAQSPLNPPQKRWRDSRCLCS